MEVYYKIIFFVFGTIFGSFFHVVGTRLCLNESIIKPSSHCHNCNHKLKWYELIPIVSYVLQEGESRCCKKRLPVSYLIMEVVTGSLFVVCYKVFGLTKELVIALIFVSSLITIIVSDIEYMIILDEVLYVATFLIIVFYLFFLGFKETALYIYAGLGAFATMYIIKLLGDRLFHKESLGGGDIKLMFLFGLVLGYPMSIVSIFLATFIAFPIALIVLFTKKDNMIPFGPFLSISAIILFITKINFTDIINFLIS